MKKELSEKTEQAIKYVIKYTVSAILALIVFIGATAMDGKEVRASEYTGEKVSEGLLTEPMLQNPGDTYVSVVWFTENDGNNNNVILYENGPDKHATKSFRAVTTRMSRLRGGKTEGDCNKASVKRSVYRHEAVVTGLPKYTGKKNEKVYYQVQTDSNRSRIYTLNAKAQPGTPQKILLTSDLQIKNMCAANYQKVFETVGSVDAIWCNGDLVDVADRAYDWFYADNSFYRVLQGTADDKIGNSRYYGGPLLQYAPLYTSVGNHDVMGKYNDSDPLNDQFNNPTTREYATTFVDFVYKDSGLTDSEREQAIIDNSFNTITYEEMFSLPKNKDKNERYYAVSIGDVRLVSLEAARVWRLSQVGVKGKYSEFPGADPFIYGFGDFIFEPIGPGSKQYDFLNNELASKEYSDAKYNVVMFHQDYHSLGGNQVPAFTDPVASVVKDNVTGKDMTIYDYPINKDYLDKYIAPLLEKSGVNMIFNAHSHVWNRFRTDKGMNVLQTSNVGNSYFCYYDDDDARPDIPSALKKGDARYSLRENWNEDNYKLNGDPYGLKPIAPSVKPLPDNTPYAGSNDITVFSVLDTADGTVSSYYYDVTKPGSEVVLFDKFEL